MLLITKKYLRNPASVDLMNEAQQMGKHLVPVVADRGVDVPEGIPTPIQLKKRYGEAVEEIISQLQIDGEPQADIPALQRGNEAYFAGNYEEALKAYKQVKAESAEALNSLGAAYNALRRHEEALEVLNRAQALDPDLAKIYLNRSLALSGLGLHEEALADDKRSLELEPQSAKVWSSHAMTLYALGRYDEASNAVHKAIDLNPGAAHHYYQLGLIAVKAGQLEEALKAVDQALNLEPDSADAASLRQIVLGRAGRVDEALEAIDRIIKKNPRQPGNYITRSLTNFYLERYEDAVADATKAMERGYQNNPAAFYNRAIAHWKLGNVEAAQKDFLQAAELYPSLKTAAGVRANAESELTRDAGLGILDSLAGDARLKAGE
jgi:superkiller protein 3